HWFEITSMKITIKNAPGNRIIGVPSNKDNPEAIKGYRSQYYMVVVDEAQAMPENIYISLLGNLSTAHCKFLLIGNHTKVNTPFFHTFSNESWLNLNVDSRDSSFCSPELISTFLRYGIDSDMFRCNIAGYFPSQNARDTILKSDELKRCFDESIPKD